MIIKLTSFNNIYVTEITVALEIESTITTEVCYLNVALKREPYCTLLYFKISAENLIPLQPFGGILESFEEIERQNMFQQ